MHKDISSFVRNNKLTLALFDIKYLGIIRYTATNEALLNQAFVYSF